MALDRAGGERGQRATATPTIAATAPANPGDVGASASDGDATARLREPAWRLVARAVGDRAAIADKARRVGRTLGVWLDRREVDRRLAVLEAQGLLDGDLPPPTRWQLWVGGLDQLRWVITPAARDYYAQRGISFAFHQVLRWLDDPVSVIDPSGLFSLRETICGHVLQVTHLDPIYDLELLQMWPDGLAAFEAEIEAMIAGRHPRAATIAAVVEDADYHRRLLAYVRAYRADRATAHMRRAVAALGDDAHFAAAAERFATLPGYLSWCQRLPRGRVALLRHLLRSRVYPLEPKTMAAARPDTATDIVRA